MGFLDSLKLKALSLVGKVEYTNIKLAIEAGVVCLGKDGAD